MKRSANKQTPATKNRVSASNGGWVRYMSPTHTGYRVLLSPRQLQAFGPPKDAWGHKMVPAKGTAPRTISA